MIAPIANIIVDEASAVIHAHLYAPGLPAGGHDLYPDCNDDDAKGL